MTLVDDLRAARALINDPTYDFAVHGFHNAMLRLPTTRYSRVRAALRDAAGWDRKSKGTIYKLGALSRTDIMVLFDRAINAALASTKIDRGHAQP